MEFPTITTDRLLLKKLTPEILTELFKNYTESEIKQELGIDKETDYITKKERYMGGYTSHNRSFVRFQLLDRQTKKSIGDCGFQNWALDHYRAEIGYSLFHDDYKRKGLMTEALRFIIPFGFNEMNLRRIEACVAPENLASQALLAKHQFTKEGLLRQHYYQDGVAYDSIIFSLLKNEFTPTINY
jgi:ribosomal-protein-alanine N-acetyltransferase